MSTPSLNIQGTSIELAEDDITTQAIDAIVNATNSQLVGGGSVFHYPLDETSHIALTTTVESLQKCPSVFEIVRFVLFDDRSFAAFDTELGKLRSHFQN